MTQIWPYKIWKEEGFMKNQNCLVSAVISLAAIAICASTANAQQEIFFANLNGPSEFPTNNSPGTGSATVTLDLALMTMRVQVDFTGLTGTTTASHIHGPTAMAFEGTAGVATTTPTFANFPLGVTSGSYDNTLDLTLSSSFNPAFVTANGGSVAASAAALISAIEQGKSYLNIHTSTFGGGEIRGFLAAVPEPCTLTLLGAGGVALLFAARRKLRRS